MNGAVQWGGFCAQKDRLRCPRSEKPRSLSCAALIQIYKKCNKIRLFWCQWAQCCWARRGCPWQSGCIFGACGQDNRLQPAAVGFHHAPSFHAAYLPALRPYYPNLRHQFVAKGETFGRGLQADNRDQTPIICLAQVGGAAVRIESVGRAIGAMAAPFGVAHPCRAQPR